MLKYIVLLLDFTLPKAEHPLKGMELTEKEGKEEKHKRWLIRKRPKTKYSY